jgi:AraC-like DNA-binding protein
VKVSAALFRSPGEDRCAAFTAVLTCLEQLATTVAPTARLDARERGRLVHLAACAAAQPDVSLFEFLALVSLLRLTASDGKAEKVGLDRIRDRTEMLTRRRWTQPGPPATLVGQMEAAGPALVHLTKERVAAALALTPAALVTLLRKDLSLSFRQLRRIILMRRAVLALASTNEQVAQIAYALGYDSANAFDRIFGRSFGIPPADYRAALMARHGVSARPSAGSTPNGPSKRARISPAQDRSRW